MGQRSCLTLKTGVCCLPKESKAKPLGEDAFFVSFDEQTIGIADGVGGTAVCGIDSGVYSRQLMRNASQFVRSQGGLVDPMAVLKHAFKKSRAAGASTACVITLRSDGVLHAVNVGDSGFWVIRSEQVVYKSPVQQTQFNCPFQLGVCPVGDTPEDAEEIAIEIERGDIIVAATDGVFDNLFDQDLEWLVTECPSYSPESLALNIGKMARKASLCDDEVSPFSMAATEAGLDYLGGKYDDITVVVGYVC